MTDSTLFVGGRVFTGRRYCEALLVENGAVVVAGTEAEARRSAPTGVETHSLSGSLLLPGLIDAHLHVAEVTRAREGLHLNDASSIEGSVEALRRWALAYPTGWIVGRGWDPERSPSRPWLTRQDLDRASTDRPVVVVHVSGHAVIANSAALSIAGFDRSTADPPGGRLGREPDGAPDGRVFEGAVRSLIGRPEALDLPGPSALRRTLQSAAALGLTTVGAMSASPEEAIALRELSRTGALPGRVRVYLHGSRWAEYFRAPTGSEGTPGRFAVVGVKEYTDGAFGTRTAWLAEPYTDDPGTAGMRVAGDEPLRALLEAIAEKGLAPALHAIGDRAVDYSLGLLEGFRTPSGRPARIEHAALTPPALFGRLARVRPVLVVQPGFVWSDHWLAARLGPDRARWAYAFRTLERQGHLLVGSSDAPYDPLDPWRGMRAAVQRTDPNGRSANATPEEALAPEEAVRLYTANAGAAFGEPALGRLEPNSPADFVRTDAPSLEAAIGAGSAAVRETWVAGIRVAAGPEGRDRETL
ncbi:MAG: amidohydrolase [Thermoplasmata archaeon]